jgi:hypothetical protein
MGRDVGAAELRCRKSAAQKAFSRTPGTRRAGPMGNLSAENSPHWPSLLSRQVAEREGLELRIATRGISNLRKRFRCGCSGKRENPSIWHWIWHWSSSLSHRHEHECHGAKSRQSCHRSAWSIGCINRVDSERPIRHRRSKWRNPLQGVAPWRKRAHRSTPRENPQRAFAG